MIFFQGDEDPVVPPNQTEAIVEALRHRGTTVGYFLFSGEQHGFRKAADIQRALWSEQDEALLLLKAPWKCSGQA